MNRILAALPVLGLLAVVGTAPVAAQEISQAKLDELCGKGDSGKVTECRLCVEAVAGMVAKPNWTPKKSDKAVEHCQKGELDLAFDEATKIR